MTTPLKYSMTNESITVLTNGGKSQTVREGAPNFLSLRSALLEGRWDDAESFLTVQGAMNVWTNGRFSFQDGQARCGDEVLPDGISDRIREMMSKGEDPAPLFRFWERLQKNPSWRSVQQLWPFIAQQNIPLTPDGCFLAYKGVQSNYRDAHSGTFDNSPGSLIQMPRNQVSDDPNTACHFGLHVGALPYARSFHSGGIVVVCKVDPADVVCIPYDSGQQKIRTCRYRVLGNYGTPLPNTLLEEPIASEPIEVEGRGETIITDTNGKKLSKEDLKEVKAEQKAKAEVKKVKPKDEEDKDLEEEAKPKKDVRVHTVKKAPESPKKTALTEKYGSLDHMGLLLVPLMDLREYATYGLEIVGASKIPGGKPALVKALLEERAKQEKASKKK